MQLYRIARCQYVTDFSGTGARLYGGRWNSVGRPMVYFSSSRALSVLEVLVHLPPALLPTDFCLVTVEVPDDVKVLPLKQLPPNWQAFPEPAQLRTLGDTFLKAGKHLLLKVPSAIVKDEYNYLLNPAHLLAAQIKIVKQELFNFDARLA